ncbi:MAG: serine--tRNA ligase, partial [Candidatus Binatia bacterium]
MLDIKLIREDPELIKKELGKVGFPETEIDMLLDTDRQRRAAIHETESL